MKEMPPGQMESLVGRTFETRHGRICFTRLALSGATLFVMFKRLTSRLSCGQDFADTPMPYWQDEEPAFGWQVAAWICGAMEVKP